MKKCAWLSDTHLNLLETEETLAFVRHLNSKKSDAIFLSGDISSGFEVINGLTTLAEHYLGDIYFVLGNHDYYKLFISETRDMVRDLCLKYSNLHYLTSDRFQSLGNSTAIVGDDGWYDGLWRNPLTSFIFAWDWYLIKDFRSLFSTSERLAFMRELATEAVLRVQEKLEAAFRTHDKVYLLLHVPPWPGKNSSKILDAFWKPYNSSKLMAVFLEDFMSTRNHKQLIILSGHTHIRRREIISSNIELRVAEADFGSPQVEDFIFI